VNGAQVFFALLCVGVVLSAVLAFEVAVFRFACRLCRVPPTGWLRCTSVVVVMLVVPAIVDGVFSGLLIEAYTATNYPLWEAGVVQFFLALPAHMAICSAIHARMVRIRLGQGVAVWLVEKLLKLALLAAVAGVIALFVLAGPGP